MIRLADPGLSPAQGLVCGRVFDSVSGQGLDEFDATLSYAHPGGPARPAGSGTLPVHLGHRADGWFVLSLPDARELADLTEPATVRLTARVTVPGRDTVECSVEVPGHRLAVVTTTVEVSGTTVVVTSIPDAPWLVSVPVEPLPVALDGIILRAHDPGDPVAGVSVSAAGGAPVVTDAAGRFFVPVLPVLAEVVLTLEETGKPPRNATVRPDYDRPVNVITLSLPG